MPSAQKGQQKAQRGVNVATALMFLARAALLVKGQEIYLCLLKKMVLAVEYC
jgi:hypothetical protein